MHRFRVALVSLVLASSSLACGTSKPPEAPTTSGTASGGGGPSASAIVPDSEADATVTADLAGIRANPLFARAVSEANNEDPTLGALVEKIDHVELRATLPKDAPPAIVGVLWGRLGTDPRQITGLGFAFDEAQSLPSGVKEYTTKGADMQAHVFVLNDGVWIVSTGANSDRVRARVSSSSAAPSAPTGDLLHIKTNASVLAHAPKELPQTYASVEKVDLALTSGASSLRAVLSFKEASGAKKATSELRMLGAFLLLAIKSRVDCKALEKISFDVKNDAKDVAIEVKGISDAIAAWDPQACKMESRDSHEERRPPKRKPTRLK